MLGSRLRTIRKQNSLTQQEVSDLLSIDRSTYTSYELGRNRPDADMLRKLARVFDVSADTILELDERPPIQLQDDLAVYGQKDEEPSYLSNLSEAELHLIALFRMSNRQAEILEFAKNHQ